MASTTLPNSLPPLRNESDTPVFPPIHLSDGDGNWLRCGFETSSTVCGDPASRVCADCGPLCDAHQHGAPCFHPSRNHQPIALPVDERRYPVTAILAALSSRRITLENGIERLRAAGAGEYLIDTVLVIESGVSCPKGDYAPLLREIGAAA
jgi:hypothetical protein